MKQRNVSEIIGDDYKKWQDGQDILITAPTGTGKTYFILHVLLDYAIQNNRKILYFVNRKVLQKQLIAEIDRLQSKYINSLEPQKRNVKNYIEVWTYQYLEEQIRQNGMRAGIINHKCYTYVVCDECHYFSCDSNYNTLTQLSFNYIRKCFFQHIRIFMSATMDNVIQNIVNTSLNANKKRVLYAPGYVPEISKNELIAAKQLWEYTVEPDYSYLNIKGFGKKEDVIGLLEEYSCKWLIFVDSIKYGNKLEREISQKFSEKKVVFVDAKYDQDEQSQQSVDHIVEKKLTDSDVLIATSVLDNGISIHDNGLRNIIIFADNRETFLQMLGRKRIDSESVNLFLPRMNKQFFQQRLYTSVLPVKNFIEKNRKYLKIEDIQNMLPQEVNWEDYRQERDFFYHIQVNEVMYRSFRRTCFFTNSDYGVYLNEFAVQRIYLLEEYYSELISSFDADEDSFLRLQLSWVGINGENADAIVTACEKNQKEIALQKIDDAIKKYLYPEKESLDTKENKQLKSLIKEPVKFLLMKSKDEYKKEYNNICKDDRNISEDIFNSIMIKLELPYRMEKIGGSTFRIKRVEPK